MNLQEADKHFIHTYNRSVIFEKGEGMYLFDNEGNKYLDMGAGSFSVRIQQRRIQTGS